ncbi:unannotated protein [freshwater metagenome]|uniref:Unannotated protein n=1 Tax=freshwater metagenome TaxID=449393 RepID=A0A6J7MJ63_9ZZZZ
MNVTSAFTSLYVGVAPFLVANPGISFMITAAAFAFVLIALAYCEGHVPSTLVIQSFPYPATPT